jgi:hypothetical protein
LKGQNYGITLLFSFQNVQSPSWFYGTNPASSIKRQSSKKVGLLQKADPAKPLNPKAKCENWHAMALPIVKPPKARLAPHVESFTY